MEYMTRPSLSSLLGDSRSAAIGLHQKQSSPLTVEVAPCDNHGKCLF